jgi:hypothetical protein
VFDPSARPAESQRRTTRSPNEADETRGHAHAPLQQRHVTSDACSRMRLLSSLDSLFVALVSFNVWPVRSLVPSSFRRSLAPQIAPPVDLTTS